MRLMLAIYKRGMAVQFKGRTEIVDHVHIRSGGLFVVLEGMTHPIQCEQVQVRLTTFDYEPPPLKELMHRSARRSHSLI